MKRALLLALVLCLALCLAAPALAQENPNTGASDAFKHNAHNQPNPSAGHIKLAPAAEYAYRAQVGSTATATASVTPAFAYRCILNVDIQPNLLSHTLTIEPMPGSPVGIAQFNGVTITKFQQEVNFPLTVDFLIDKAGENFVDHGDFVLVSPLVHFSIFYDITVTAPDGSVFHFFQAETEYHQ